MLKVSPTEYFYIYIMYIVRTDFEHHLSQLFRIRIVLSRFTFHKKCFFRWDTKNKVIYLKIVNNPFNINLQLSLVMFPQFPTQQQHKNFYWQFFSVILVKKRGINEDGNYRLPLLTCVLNNLSWAIIFFFKPVMEKSMIWY